ncbi:MFS transporter [Halomonas urmiana]|uniref:MFS transporter n=1 Tax=Halomonas urmiana TaxID=490901 RepID=A0A5R8MHF1_9GAMM|nr:MFS transporter [Halomonas urmiana]
MRIVSESWLNNRATNLTRGRMLAVCMVVMYLGQGGGQLLLNVAAPSEADLFILSSTLISVALLPLLLSAMPAPDVSLASRMSVSRLCRISLFGARGVFVAGLINGTIMGMGAVYAHDAGLSVARIALFMGAVICGGSPAAMAIGATLRAHGSALGHSRGDLCGGRGPPGTIGGARGCRGQGRTAAGAALRDSLTSGVAPGSVTRPGSRFPTAATGGGGL